MNKILVGIVFMFLSVSFVIGQNQRVEKSEMPLLVFEKTTFDFGKILQNSDGTCEFAFTNKGKKALILTNLKSSCGCTVPEWSKDPIKNGRSGVVKVKYITNKSGKFSKSITVYSNANIIGRVSDQNKPAY